MAKLKPSRGRVGPGERLRAALLLGLIPALLTLGLLRWPISASLEKGYGLDLLFKLRGPRRPPPEVCVVAIDEGSKRELGIGVGDRWPRALHGELVRTLAREGARSVSFDVLFDEPRDREQDVQLELGLFEAGNVVLGSTVERVDDPRFRQVRQVEPYGPFAESAAAVGEVELPPDGDGVIREAWLTPGDRPSLALAGYVLATGDRSFDGERGTRLIDYYGPPRTIPTVSIYQALDPAQYLPDGFFHDRIVFVGLSQVAALDIDESKDSFPTPFSGGEVGFTYGVEIHATIAANLVERRRLVPLSGAAELALVVVAGLLATVLFVQVRPLVGIFPLLALQLSWWVAAWGAFGRALWIPAVIPTTVLLPVAYVTALVWYYLTTVRERENIRRAFSFYLSPEMISKIADSPESLSLGGEEVVGTALFTDIKGFTSIAESMSAPETARMLNEYFSEVTGTIFDTGGTLIKYIGDAVFAIWGAPVKMDDHATQACRAAVAMARMQEGSDGSPAGRLVTRIGVHTGSMLVGNLGSSQRFDYTAIGDTVNLAARLESLNKSVGTLALASGEAMAATDGSVATRPLGRVRVVGRHEPVELHELLGLAGEPTRPDAAALARFAAALADFRARRFREAAAGFEAVRAACGGTDGPSQLYLARIEELRARPPGPDWDGVINFLKK